MTTRKGHRLGLPVKKIIEEHGGTLVLTDAEPLDDTGHRGPRAKVTLPLAERRRPEPRTGQGKRHGMTDVLIVDDERDIRTSSPIS